MMRLRSRSSLRRLLASCFLALGATGAIAQSRLETYVSLKHEQKWEEALKVIREEIASPSSVLKYRLGQVRKLALDALADYVQHSGTTSGMDDEAARYHREGIEYFAGNAGDSAKIDWAYGIYLSHTYRTGLSIPYMRRYYDYVRKLGRPFDSVEALRGFAIVHAEIGDDALANYYTRQVLDIYARHFASIPRGPDDWQKYLEFLQSYAFSLAADENVPELERVLKIVQTAVEHARVMKSLSNSRLAQAFAIAGAVNRAEQLFIQAGREWDQESGKLSPDLRERAEIDFLGAEGTMHLYARRYRKAVETFDAFDKKWRARGLAAGSGVRGVKYSQSYGRALEGAGEPARAAAAYRDGIALVEKARDSFGIADRARFFRNSSLSLYHGLIRITAQQAAAANDIGRFWEAVQASELVRARQLGDYISPEAPPILSVAALESIRAKLAPNEAVLYFTATDTDLVILGFNKERYLSVVKPVREFALDKLVKQIARDLSRPESAQGEINRKLQMVGKFVLGDVGELLNRATELIVLPDGMLNLIPFDLLSIESQTYQPLMQTHKVRLSPSLRFADMTSARAPSASGLFAVADPVFKLERLSDRIDLDELKKAVRGSRFLDNFEPLPETRTEAEAIRGILGGEHAEVLLGRDATESQVKRKDLSQYAYLHFATHGILGREVPGIGEPALVLADEVGEDGFLTASEAAGLKLNARLTVLSACNTGTGEYVDGEGVMGMSRAFLLAGSRAVVMSLWPVASKATERLMVKFYGNLKTGQTPHEALRDAKLALRDEAGRTGSIERHPFFWSPFVIFGF